MIFDSFSQKKIYEWEIIHSSVTENINNKNVGIMW